jgi:hypothetical protein
VKRAREVYRIAPNLKLVACVNDGIHSQFFQTNIPMEEWSRPVRDAVVAFVYHHLAQVPNQFSGPENIALRLGSGFFERGMNEIFYVVPR